MRMIKILIIEDNPGDRNLIKIFLNEDKAFNYEIHESLNLEDGLKFLLVCEVDLVLLDLALPDSYGIDTLKKFRSVNARVPVVVLTGIDNSELGLQTLQYGAQDYIAKKQIEDKMFTRILHYAIERKKAEEQIKFLAYYDYLTKLPNRILFIEHFNNVIASCKRHNRNCSILYIDIDNFKIINDTLGHHAGDSLLIEVSKKFKKCIRRDENPNEKNGDLPIDLISRFGGDEFVIALTEIAIPEDSSKVAQRILNEFSKPIIMNSKEIKISPSIGISIFPNDGTFTDTLLKNADMAMYEAKKKGKNNFQFYNESMNQSMLKFIILENKINYAIEHNGFILHYQPKMDLKKNIITGMEALIRIVEKDGSILPPLDFIPFAENNNMINKIGYWLINKVCEKISYWKTKNISLPIAVNISVKQFKDKNFISNLKNITKEHNVSSEMIELEITENVFIEDAEESINTVKELIKLGFNITIDDFGEGFSSFNVLKKISFYGLKIGKYFMQNIPENKEDSSIVSAMITMAHSLNLKVTAEGIEEKSQLDFLKNNDCDELQGYILSKPIHEDDLMDLLKNEKKIISDRIIIENKKN